MGNGWNNKEHHCYGGCIKDKSEVYHRFKFALCYENIEGLSGYITEKIFDCLVNGVVPVYAGAPDIEEYIPSGAFIRLRDFDNYDQLYEYISSMSEYRYSEYLKCAENIFLPSIVEAFSGKKYADYILLALKKERQFRCHFFFINYLSI